MPPPATLALPGPKPSLTPPPAKRDLSQLHRGCLAASPLNRAPSRPSVFSSWYAAPPHRAELWQLLHLCPSTWSLHPESKCSGRLWEGLDPACLLESPLDFPLPSLPLSMTLPLTLTLPPRLCPVHDLDPDPTQSMTLNLTLTLTSPLPSCSSGSRFPPPLSSAAPSPGRDALTFLVASVDYKVPM